jgi:membrane associated rhomboid family serine protease
MRRYPSSPYASSFSFGPGGISTTIKALIGANALMFVAQILFPVITDVLGLHPSVVLRSFWLWQPVTYMFLHSPHSVLHILFNMLGLWMFGTELERLWGTRYFLKFYFVTGIGAGLLTILFSLLPFTAAESLYGANVIGASGAIFGLMLAYAMYFPDRQIIFYIFPIPTKVFVTIMGAIALFSSFGDSGGVASATHLGGLAVAYVFLKSARVHPLSELKYRYLKWKINRVRKKFDVYSGGRANDYDRRVH